MFAFQGKHANFGDDLNPWLWSRILPGFFDDDPARLFIGIGSTLYDHFPAEARKIVFGAGYAGYSALPTIDANWDIRFVRGLGTAKALGLSPELAIGDAAILIRATDVPPRPKRYKASYMPHFESATNGSWEAVCQQAGIHFIDPRWTVEHVLDDMLASELMISEAMHGVIVADALRVPWRAIQPLDPNHRAKWLDWAGMLEVDVDFTPLGPSNGVEWLMTKFWGWRRAIYAMRKRRANLAKAGLARPLGSAVRGLRRAAGLRGQLSPDAAIERATQRMLAEVERLKRDYP